MTLIPVRATETLRAAFRSRFFRATALMAVVNAFASLAAFLYQVSMAHLLTATEFGTLISLLAVFVILSVLAPAFQLAAAKFAGQASTHGEEGQLKSVWVQLLKSAFLLGSIATIAALLLMPVLSWFLHIESITLLVFLATSFLFAFAYPVNMGILQGLRRYKWLAAAVLATPLTRFILGSALVMLGFGVLGAFLPYTVGFVAVFAAALLLFRRLPSEKGGRTRTQGSVSYMVWTALAYGSFIVLANADVVFARHYLDPQAAGEYAALSVLGRIVLFAPVGVTIVLFAETAGGGHGSSRRIALLAVSVAYTIIACGAALLVYGLFPDFVVRTVVGEEYRAITPLLFRYGTGMLGLAVTFLLMHFYLAMNRRSVTYPILIGIVLHLLLIALFHGGVSTLANIRLFTGLFTPIAIGVYGVLNYRFVFPRPGKVKT